MNNEALAQIFLQRLRGILECGSHPIGGGAGLALREFGHSSGRDFGRSQIVLGRPFDHLLKERAPGRKPRLRGQPGARPQHTISVSAGFSQRVWYRSLVRLVGIVRLRRRQLGRLLEQVPNADVTEIDRHRRDQCENGDQNPSREIGQPAVNPSLNYVAGRDYQ